MITPQSPREHLSGLQEQQLFDLARNESAQWLFRKAAAGLLKEKGHLKANHPEIANVLTAFMADVVAVSHESEVSAPVESPEKTEIVVPVAVQTPDISPVSTQESDEPGPFKASVTTASLNADPIIENGQK